MKGEKLPYAGAYREGLEALLDQYEARRRGAAERAHALDAEARTALLPEHRRELEDAEARLVQSPSTREDLEAVEGVLDAYEKQVEIALAVIAELRERRAGAFGDGACGDGARACAGRTAAYRGTAGHFSIQG